MYVASRARGKGTGRALLETLIARVRDVAGLEQLLIDVSVPQTAARALYAALGFRTYGVEPRALLVDGTYVDEEHMILVLR